MLCVAYVGIRTMTDMKRKAFKTFCVLWKMCIFYAINISFKMDLCRMRVGRDGDAASAAVAVAAAVVMGYLDKKKGSDAA